MLFARVFPGFSISFIAVLLLANLALSIYLVVKPKIFLNPDANSQSMALESQDMVKAFAEDPAPKQEAKREDEDHDDDDDEPLSPIAEQEMEHQQQQHEQHEKQHEEQEHEKQQSEQQEEHEQHEQHEQHGQQQQQYEQQQQQQPEPQNDNLDHKHEQILVKDERHE